MSIEYAYTAVIDKKNKAFALGIAERDVAGYSLDRDGLLFTTYEAASAEARSLNAALGLSERESMEIITSSIRAQNLRR